MKSLKLSQRQAIAEGIQNGKSNAQIARQIGVHRATVGREIARNAASREEYAALLADDLSWQRKQDAVKRHKPVQFGGVAYFTELQQHHRFYTYLSKNHYSETHDPADYLPVPWNPAFVRRYEQLRLMPDSSYLRLRLRFQLWNTAEPVHIERPSNPLQEAIEALQEGMKKWRTVFLEVQAEDILSVPRKTVPPRQTAKQVAARTRSQASAIRNKVKANTSRKVRNKNRSTTKVGDGALPQERCG